MAESPFAGLDSDDWKKRTITLVQEHPLSTTEVVEVVLQSWTDIFSSRFGRSAYRIGRDIFPSPQIIAFLLHELIALELSTRYPNQWRRDSSNEEKDLVYIPNYTYSTEIKASSSASSIYGNRSYAQENSASRKYKAGYYIAVNFQRLNERNRNPQVTMIRMGWLDHSDWRGQKAPTGQQASLTPDAKRFKLLQLYSISEKTPLGRFRSPTL